MAVFIDVRVKGWKMGEDVQGFIEEVVNSVLREEDCAEDYEVSVSLVNNQEIQQLNEQYRGIDLATDVLSFPMGEGVILGDIVISIEKVKEQAEEYGHSFERELAFLLVHGMLHLLGYDHESASDEKIMFSKQNYILNKLDIKR